MSYHPFKNKIIVFCRKKNSFSRLEWKPLMVGGKFFFCLFLKDDLDQHHALAVSLINSLRVLYWKRLLRRCPLSFTAELNFNWIYRNHALQATNVNGNNPISRKPFTFGNCWQFCETFMFVRLWTWIQLIGLDTVKMNATRKIQRRAVLRYVKVKCREMPFVPFCVWV